MKEEKLIKKWLNDELTPEELKAFKSLDAYSSYVKISENAKRFKAPEFDESKSLSHITNKTSLKKQPAKSSPFKYILAAAALVVIIFSAVTFLDFDSDQETYTTEVARTETVQLPDESIADLGANSTLSFSAKTWKDERKLELDGEAFFKVQAGKTFTVQTNYGSVKVLGTEFNVKSRPYGFEVTCYEGSVQVQVKGEKHVLKAKDKLTIGNENIVINETLYSTPDWTRNATILKSTPIGEVLKEFQNFYDVDFDTSEINTSRLYTGSFTHNDLENALKSITLPLGLTYQINGTKVVLSK